MKRLRFATVAVMTLAGTLFSADAKAAGTNGALSGYVENADPANAVDRPLLLASGDTGVQIASIMKSIGSGSTGSDSLAAAATLSLSLSLLGVVVLGLGLFGHKKRAGSGHANARTEFEARQSGAQKWTRGSVVRERLARLEKAGSLR